MPIALDGIRTCISGIRAHSASDCTTTAGTPPVSRNKHFRHSPVSPIVKQSCMKHSNSYLRDRDAKHLQGPPLSRTRRVRERRKIELTVCVCVWGGGGGVRGHGIWHSSSGTTAWCSEIGSVTSLIAPELHASCDVREPIHFTRLYLPAIFFLGMFEYAVLLAMRPWTSG